MFRRDEAFMASQPRRTTMHDAALANDAHDLTALPERLIQLVEDTLSNDEISTDAELVQYLAHNGLSRENALHALRYREIYLSNLWVAGCTPIRGGLRIRLNVATGRYELA
jgi:hypothetical protein